MTAQISLSITLVSVLIIAVFVSLTGQFVRTELREENELTLLANLAFIRDDLAATGYDLTQAPRLVEATERRVHRLHAAILDGDRAPRHRELAALPSSAADGCCRGRCSTPRCCRRGHGSPTSRACAISSPRRRRPGCRRTAMAIAS